MNRTLLMMAVIATVGAATACSDALVDIDYHGEPLLELEGKVEQLEAPGFTGAWGVPGKQTWGTPDGEAPSEGDLQLAMFWSAGAADGDKDSLVTAVEQQAVTTSSFPARYRLTLYRPPPEALMHTDEDGAGRYTIGLLVVYVDLDRDGTWNAEVDKLVGGAPGRAIAYTDTGADSVHFGHLESGYHRLRESKSKGKCTKDGRLQLIIDDKPDLDLQMAAGFSPNVLVDLDCDGNSYEWGKACPSKKTVRWMCDYNGKDRWPCKGCPK